MSDVQLNCMAGECGLPQRHTRSGAVCKAGHGGAPGKCPQCDTIQTYGAHCPVCSTPETTTKTAEIVTTHALRVSREEAVEFTKLQLDDKSPATADKTAKTHKWHYGKIEIQELLDYIYGYNAKGEKVGPQRCIIDTSVFSYPLPWPAKHRACNMGKPFTHYLMRYYYVEGAKSFATATMVCASNKDDAVSRVLELLALKPYIIYFLEDDKQVVYCTDKVDEEADTKDKP